MDAKDINEIAEIVAKHVTSSIDYKIVEMRKDVDSHEAILKGKNGDAGLSELVRRNTDSIRRLYAAISIIGTAIVLEIINWAIPKIELLFDHIKP